MQIKSKEQSKSSKNKDMQRGRERENERLHLDSSSNFFDSQFSTFSDDCLTTQMKGRPEANRPKPSSISWDGRKLPMLPKLM